MRHGLIRMTGDAIFNPDMPDATTMTTLRSLLLIGSLLALAGCYDQEREARLTQRERNLLVREKQFSRKEAEYLSLQKMRDSLLLAMKDTASAVTAWPDEIAGYWSSKVICTESGCTDYIVGDQRNDTWFFTTDSTRMVTKVINNNKLIRVYNSSFDGKAISLSFSTDSTASKQVTMSVLLNDLSPNKIKGTRTISVHNGCTARFTVELSRNPGKE